MAIYSWKKDSWQTKCSLQIPSYPCKAQLNTVIKKLSKFPGLVNSDEIKKLHHELMQVAKGEKFILQIGDCAERFHDCHPSIINNKIQHLTHLGTYLMERIKKPIVHIGRIAGQYAKPRSSEYELHHGVEIPSYRGDMINDINPSLAARIATPERMLLAYQCAKKVINHIKSMKNNPFPIYTSHEALLLYYEQALTKKISSEWYNLSTHFPWLGMRTVDKSVAHIEYLRGLLNPIAIKVGPQMLAESLGAVVKTLNPSNRVGKITLILRLGAKNITRLLPNLIEFIRTSKLAVIWICDPMHGNTEILNSSGKKTRFISDILYELEQSVKIHAQMGSVLHGLHLETSYEHDLLECIDRNESITTFFNHLKSNSLVDPRLNYTQSIQVMSAFTEFMCQAYH